MNLPLDLQTSPWSFRFKPNPPTEGKPIPLMYYCVKLEEGVYNLYNHVGTLLLTWDDWDEMLEMLNVWPQNAKDKAMWDSFSANRTQPSSSTSESPAPKVVSTVEASKGERSVARKSRGT